MARQGAPGLLGYARWSFDGAGDNGTRPETGGPLLSPLDTELLEILVCPETHRPVALADAVMLERVNRAVQSGVVSNRRGEAVSTPLEALLVRDDGLRAYPVRDDIPIMLIDESIDLTGLSQAPATDAPRSP
ncbi:MAG: hypothetical protein HKN71_13030 [Gemmatimonadetes bacterium]|nr:hypothetical protein [Gemmatimonadota bacterium]